MHEEALAMKGRLHNWPAERLRVSATLIFWLGIVLSVIFSVLIDQKDSTPLAQAGSVTDAVGLIVGGVVLGIGCLFGGVYAEVRGRPFGGALRSLGRRARG